MKWRNTGVALGVLSLFGTQLGASSPETGRFLRNTLSGKCIDVKGAPGTDNRAPLQLWDCELSGEGPNHTITDQRWEMTGDGFIRNMLSGKCIDVKGAPGVDNGAPLQLWDCETSGEGPNHTITDQRWEMVGGGFIRNRLSGKCIDVDGTPGTDNRARLQLWDCETSGWGPHYTGTDQRWRWR